jgi:hypothetical protein
LTKKFCEKFFSISKVQHQMRQVITFMQGEEEGIDQAWNRFHVLIDQGPRLVFFGDVLLHTFFFSLTTSCMEHVQMCAGGDIMDKTLMEAAQLLQKISKMAAMRRNWETRLSGQPEHNSGMKTCAEISQKETTEDKKEEPIQEKLEEVHTKIRTTPSVDFAKSSEIKEEYVKRKDIKGVQSEWIGFAKARHPPPSTPLRPPRQRHLPRSCPLFSACHAPLIPTQ